VVRRGCLQEWGMTWALTVSLHSVEEGLFTRVGDDMGPYCITS